MDPLDGTVSLELPADPASLSVVRAVVASVGSRLALSYDSVDDLRIAAVEAGAVVLSAGRGARLRIDLVPSQADLCLTIWVEGDQPTPIDDREGLAWRVIEGLVDEMNVIEVEGASAIEMRIRTVSQ